MVPNRTCGSMGCELHIYTIQINGITITQQFNSDDNEHDDAIYKYK
jgi:hypothetical protein